MNAHGMRQLSSVNHSEVFTRDNDDPLDHGVVNLGAYREQACNRNG